MKRSDYTPKYPVQTLEKSMDVLLYMVNHPTSQGNTITGISEGTGISKSGVHRILDTFLSYRIVEKLDASQTYRLGWGLYEMGLSVPSTNNLLSTNYGDVMSALCQDLSETVNLAIRSDNEIVIIDRREPESRLHASSVIGDLQPLHSTSMGKLFLAELGNDEIRSYYSSHPIVQRTENTIVSSDAMIVETANISKLGYAMDYCEFEPDLICVAMPIRDYTGKIAAAMGVSGHATHMTHEMIDRSILGLRQATSKISRALGYQEPARGVYVRR